MNKVALDDIMGLDGYEKVREEFRRRIIELKKKRRVAVGEQVSLVFENRDTVIFQIQEMLRAERITDLDKIREEIDTYNDLVPGAGELSATLFLEIADQERLRPQLLKFLGIDEAVFFKIGGRSIHACFEAGRSKEDKISAVQYIKFPMDQEAIGDLLRGEKAELTINHPNYQATVPIHPETRTSLIDDLAASQSPK